jgi:hypothetical protein
MGLVDCGRYREGPMNVGIVEGAFPHGRGEPSVTATGGFWFQSLVGTPYRDVNEYLPKFKQVVAEAGRDAGAVPITLFGGTEDVDLLKRYRDMDVARVVTTLPPEPVEKTLPVLDHWAALIRRVNAG